MTALTTHEQRCLDDADYFTAARGLGRNRKVERFGSLPAAEDYASGYGDGRTMIYAVTADGSCGHIKNA